MKRIIFFIVLIFPAWNAAQTPMPTPPPANPVSTPQTQSQPPINPAPIPSPGRQSPSRLYNTVESLALAQEERERAERLKLARQMVDELYRKPALKDLTPVKIDEATRQKFAGFLRQENTGLFKFLTSGRCAVNPDVVTATEDCLSNKMPGAGASYSFRINNYRIPQLSDLSFAENMFITAGNWLHGLLLEIGDIPLEQVNLQTKEVQSLSAFAPANSIMTAREIDAKLLEGIKHEGNIYQRMLPARETTTYLLRSIAYRGVVNRTAQGFVYNELDYDNRKDLLIAFRIVQTEPDGSIIILWKQLAVKDSPKIVKPN